MILRTSFSFSFLSPLNEWYHSFSFLNDIHPTITLFEWYCLLFVWSDIFQSHPWMLPLTPSFKWCSSPFIRIISFSFLWSPSPLISDTSLSLFLEWHPFLFFSTDELLPLVSTYFVNSHLTFIVIVILSFFSCLQYMTFPLRIFPPLSHLSTGVLPVGRCTGITATSFNLAKDLGQMPETSAGLSVPGRSLPPYTATRKTISWLPLWLRVSYPKVAMHWHLHVLRNVVTFTGLKFMEPEIKREKDI